MNNVLAFNLKANFVLGVELLSNLTNFANNALNGGNERQNIS